MLAVELKNAVGSVNLGTLGKGLNGDYGGRMARILRSASRLRSSSDDQLRLMSETVLQGAKLGTLENALFATSQRVSEAAKGVFKGVYRLAEDGTVLVDKAVRGGNAWQKIGAALASSWAAVKTAGRELAVTLGDTSTTTMPFIAVPAFYLDPTCPYSPFYSPAYEKINL